MKGRVREAGVFAVAAGAFILASALAYGASAGHLDRSFGHDGQVVLRDTRGIARAVAVGRHNRIVVAGDNVVDDVERHDTITVARLLSHGRVDNRFGQQGLVTLRFDAFAAHATSVAIAPKGGIVVAGSLCSGPELGLGSLHPCRFVIARLQRNGDIDRDFGDGGTVEIRFPQPFAYAQSVAIGPRGRILVGGSNCDARRSECAVALAALRSDGTLDQAFGRDGKVVSSINRPGERCGNRSLEGSVREMAVDSRDRIVVLAECGGRHHGRAVVARFKPNGKRDPSFGTRGIVERGLGIRQVRAFAIDSHDRIDAAGTGHRPSVAKVARLERTGSRDRSFGKHGTAKVRFRHRIDPYSVAIDSRGRVVVGGSSGSGSAFARFRHNGRVDRRFGRHGKVTVGKPKKRLLTVPGGMAVDARDRIIASGTVFHFPRHFALIRLLG